MHPHDLSVRVFLDLLFYATEWEWGYFFEPHDCNVVDFALLSLVFKIVVDLARTNDHSLDLRAWDKISFLVWQDSFESITFLELLDVRACSFEFE